MDEEITGKEWTYSYKVSSVNIKEEPDKSWFRLQL